MKVSLNLSTGDTLEVELSNYSLQITTPNGSEAQIRVKTAEGLYDVNPAIYLIKPNTLGVVYNRGEGPGDGVLQDETNRIKNIGV